MGKDYSKLAQDILNNVGGNENVSSLVHCATRLRFKLLDESKVNIDVLKSLEGVITVIKSGGQIQVVIGNKVDTVFDAIMDIASFSEKTIEDAETKKRGIALFIETISGIFAPMLGILSGAGMLKALLILVTTIGVLSEKMGTYQILNAAGDGVFKYLPIILAYTSAKKFKTDPFIAMGVAFALVYPDITALYNAQQSLTFLKIPVVLVSYLSSVMPIIASVYCLSKLQKVLKKIVPDVTKFFLLPMLELLIIVPATFLFVGPLMNVVSHYLAVGYMGLVGINPIIAGGIIGAIWPLAIIFGLHWGFFPIVINNISTLGKDTLFVITGPGNLATAGAALGVFFKTKDKKLKEISGSAAFSAALAGITEPAVYGVTLPYKRPFAIAAVFSGIAGMIAAASGVALNAVVGTSLLSLPAFLGKGFAGFLLACAVAFFGSAICTFVFGFNDSMLVPSKKEKSTAIEPMNDEELYAVVDGNMIALNQVNDEIFASGMMGQGVAFEPANGNVVSPVKGTIVMVAQTGHAVGIQSDAGSSVLIHIGMDTVNMHGTGFDVKVKPGDTVNVGDLLVVADLEEIRKAQYDTIIPVVITNSDQYAHIAPDTYGEKKIGSPMMKLEGSM